MVRVNPGAQPLAHPTSPTLRESLRSYLDPRARSLLFLGFSSGLPLLLIFSTLSIWLREAGIDRTTITMFSWAALAFSFKFVWAPLFDRMAVPLLCARLGHRRGWMLSAQFLLVASLWAMSLADPNRSLTTMALAAVAIGFSAASQDIAIDAYRIECAPDALQPMLAAMYQAGYRIAMILAGAGALRLADRWDGDAYDVTAWQAVYRVMAVAALVGVVTTLVIREPPGHRKLVTGGRDPARFFLSFLLVAAAFAALFALAPLPTVQGPLLSFLREALRLLLALTGAVATAALLIRVGLVPREHWRQAYVAPVAEFFSRFGHRAVLILALIMFYRVADIVMGATANLFYLDLGFSKTTIGDYSKFYGLLATLFGAFLGANLAERFGLLRMVFWGGFFASTSNLLFSWLAVSGASKRKLIAVIAADNTSSGVAGAVFVAFPSSLTSRKFTATHYAMFTSVMTLLPKVVAGYSGAMVDHLGYAPFYAITAVLGIPALVLVAWLGRRGLTPEDTP